MSKYHSTVSRRDFMKGLGLAGAGLGAAAVAVPVFHDLDEVGTSPKATYKQPWWVKDLEIEKPSNQVDWSLIPGSDWSRSMSLPGNAEYEQQMELKAAAALRLNEQREQGLLAGSPGWALRDYALSAASNRFGPSTSTEGDTSYRGGRPTTPEERGVPKWTGTKEEANNMVRAALHFFGSPKIGVIDITSSNIRKLATTSTLEKIPSECKWALVYLVGQPTEMTKRGRTQQNVGSGVGYSWGPILQNRIQCFLISLGYQALSLSIPAQNVAAGALSGTGELCRISHQITWEWGPIIRYTRTIVTDLPMEPTKPIDAGMFRFCRTCMACAKACRDYNGYRCLSLEKEASFEVTGPWNRPGYEAYHIYWPTCSFCPYCQGACPYTTHNMSHIHELVKTIAATTPIFNSFFANMEHNFGYGIHDSPELLEDWWDRDLNTWPHDIILR